MAKTQPFPDGASVRLGYCAGAFCRDERKGGEVVRCRVGPTWRTALDIELCADCLADFAVADQAIPDGVQLFAVVGRPGGNAEPLEIPHMHIYAEATDGRYHEVKAGHEWRGTAPAAGCDCDGPPHRPPDGVRPACRKWRPIP